MGHRDIRFKKVFYKLQSLFTKKTGGIVSCETGHEDGFIKGFRERMD